MTTTFDHLGVAEPLRLALAAENHIEPTPIQRQAIPVVLAGRDLLAVAETGTGKTAAFALPLLQRLSLAQKQPTPNAPRALILAPTRELASQIDERIMAYGSKLKLKTAVIFGGVGHGQQFKALKAGVDILVATPGRLLELITLGHVRLTQIEVLVLDEADRMLDMGFVRDVRKIVGLCPKRRQTLLFSATMPSSITALARELLHDAVRVDISPAKVAVDRIAQRVYFVGAQDKRTLLTALVKDPAVGQTIVFTRTKRGADRVCRHLVQAGLAAVAIHGNKAQNARVKALAGFRGGKVRILVATDIASRGIDISDVSHVINFELPNEPESYVHRIGRTARAGADGVALSLCDPSETSYLKAIERLMRANIPVLDHQLPERPAAETQQRQTHRAAVRNDANPRSRSRGRRAKAGASVAKAPATRSRLEAVL